MKGKQCCDDIKAQLDQVSDQIKQAEHAQHDSPAAAAPVSFSAAPRQLHDSVHGRSRSSSRSVSPVALDNLRGHRSRKLPSKEEKKRKRNEQESFESQSDSGLRQQLDKKKKPRPPEDRGSKKTAKELSVEKIPSSKQRKPKAGDINADAASRGTSPAASDEEEHQGEARVTKVKDKLVGVSKDLPQLKKKRHMLYKQLQDARQQVSCFEHICTHPLLPTCKPKLGVLYF